jgi:hypothetical protein
VDRCGPVGNSFPALVGALGPTSGPKLVIQADYAKIKQDVQSLQSDQKTLARTLQADQ